MARDHSGAGHRVWFSYDAYTAQGGERLTNSPLTRMAMIDQTPGNPFDAVLFEVLRDAKPGYRVRVLAPTELLDANKPERAQLR